MVFKDLEARLLYAFKQLRPEPDESVKARIKANVSGRFKAQQQRQTWLGWRTVFARTLSLGVMSALLLGTTGVVELPLLGNQVVGQIASQGGVVEIIRGDQSLLVTDPTELYKGDWVHVGHRGQATITTEHFSSSVDADSRLKVEKSNTVFLDKGRLHNTHWQSAKVKTNRGLVKSSDGGMVAIEVLETGETHVLPDTARVAVYDLNNGRRLAGAGEKVVLRSDTVLSTSNFPDDLELSNAQIEAILGKLVIARTKALTGIENMMLGERDRAHKEILSAEQSFRSVAQILETERDLTIARRVNLDAVAVNEVYTALSEKTDRLDLLTEAYSLEQLFAVLAQNRNRMAFAPMDTGVEAYDRYVLLHRLAALGTPEQAAALYSLADNYVVSVLRKVQQSPVRIEQLAYLNAQVDALPVNQQSEQFLRSLQQQLSPDLGVVLGEKLDYLF